jgi:hypothetical protein
VITYTVSPVSPAKAYYVHGTMNNCPTKFLIDTGAAVTLMFEELWNQSGRKELSPLSTKMLVGVDGSPLDVEGSAVVGLSLGTERFHHEIIVVKGLTTRAIIGLDFLEKHGCVVDTSNRSLIFRHRQNNTVPLGDNNISEVYLEGTTTILPMSEVHLVAKISGSVVTGPCLIERSLKVTYQY